MFIVCFSFVGGFLVSICPTCKKNHKDHGHKTGNRRKNKSTATQLTTGIEDAIEMVTTVNPSVNAAKGIANSALSMIKRGQSTNNIRLTRVWVMPMVLALLCTCMLVYSYIKGQSALGADTPLSGPIIQTLNDADQKVTDSVNSISAITKRKKCDPVDLAVLALLSIASKILLGGISDALGNVLEEIKATFDSIPKLDFNTYPGIFIAPPLLCCLMLPVGFIITIIPLPRKKAITILRIVEGLFLVLILINLIFYIVGIMAMTAIVSVIPLFNVQIEIGPLVHYGLLSSIVMILAFVDLKINQLMPLDK